MYLLSDSKILNHCEYAEKSINFNVFLFFIIVFMWFVINEFYRKGRRRTRQRKIGNSGSRTELPNLNDHEAVQR